SSRLARRGDARRARACPLASIAACRPGAAATRAAPTSSRILYRSWPSLGVSRQHDVAAGDESGELGDVLVEECLRRRNRHLAVVRDQVFLELDVGFHGVNNWRGAEAE